MNTVRVTKQFDFEFAHALHNYDGKCKNIHGHSYHLDVTLLGTPISDINDVKLGMVIDFGDMKKWINKTIIDEFDHAVVLNNLSPHKDLGKILMKEGHKIILVDYQPTCENMIIDFAEKIRSILPAHIQLHSLLLRETATSYAEWHAADQ